MNQAATQSTSLYQPLDAEQRHIRLLEVSSALQNGLIECRLNSACLIEAKYVVLSYRWGSSDATYEIILNGHSFRVRENLWSFLHVIREQPGMMLWVDALCINQEDIAERNQQVRIMGEIFQSAAMVMSWLGAGDPVIEEAFEIMNRVWVSSGIDDESDALPVLHGESEDRTWQAISKLCNLQYWGRVWVVQEVLLSSNNYLLCGTKTLPWQVFANFVSLIDVRFQCPPQYARSIHNSTAKSYAASKPYAMVPQELQWRIGSALRHDYGKAWDTEEYNLFRILTMFGGRDCTDPHDHVYALLSLTTEGERFPIQYGIDQIDLYLTILHFCGQSALQEPRGDATQEQLTFTPYSQRAFIRNAKYLAETMELVSTYQRTSPYFHGAATTARGLNPRPDPCFPCRGQTIMLQCTTIEPGNEPPVLRSNTLRRSLEAIPFDVLLHLNESSSWLMCRRLDEAEYAMSIAIVTIKDGPQGRGFRILEPGMLSGSTIQREADASALETWTMSVSSAAYLDLLKVVILGIQPG